MGQSVSVSLAVESVQGARIGDFDPNTTIIIDEVLEGMTTEDILDFLRLTIKLCIDKDFTLQQRGTRYLLKLTGKSIPGNCMYVVLVIEQCV